MKTHSLLVDEGKLVFMHGREIISIKAQVAIRILVFNCVDIMEIHGA